MTPPPLSGCPDSVVPFTVSVYMASLARAAACATAAPPGAILSALAAASAKQAAAAWLIRR